MAQPAAADGVSFVLATRNRRELAAACIRSCLVQRLDCPSEVIVYDDASEDGTAEYLRRCFPAITIRRSPNNVGQPAARATGYSEARYDWIVSLDDDLLFFDPSAVQRALGVARAEERVGAVAMTYYQQGAGRPESGGPSEHVLFEVRSFLGCCVVLNRAAALECGCYPFWIYRQGEERFLSIPLLDRDYRILAGGPPVAIHLVSPVRDRQAMSWYGVRNTLLFDSICVPHPYCVPYLFKDACKLFLYKLSLRNLPTKLAALSWGLFSVLRMAGQRNPVSKAAFRKYVTLPRHGATPLPARWSREPLVRLGVIAQPGELDNYLGAEG